MNKLYAIAGLSLLGVLVPCFANANLDCSQSFSCNKTVYETLRYDRSYLFEDDFHANEGDKRLWSRCVTFSEPYDYNQGTNPTIGWTDELRNNNWKVASNTTMTVLTSNPAYRIKAVPPTRSYDNLAIKYTLEYSTDEAGKDKHAHTECIYYEISRCGDGKLDTNYGETCDPEDSSKKNWGNGGCDYSCKPVNVEAPVCNSDYNGQRLSALVEGSYLCTKGTVTGFTYNSNTHKWTWRCDNTAGDKVDCSATQPYCGDGIKDAGETCDPKDPNQVGWGNGGCDTSCNPITVEDPLCNSNYNGKRIDNLSNSSELCTKGTVTGFKYNTATYTWTWSCENSLKKSVDCSAVKPYCGDGIKDAGETCDPKDPNQVGWGNGGCDTSCNPVTVDGPSCSSDYNGKRVDNLTESPALCTKGAVTGFNYNTGTYTWTWSCENSLKESVSCSAVKPYCGDGIKDAGEACDPKDTSRVGWGNGGCSDSCQAVTVDDPLCNSDYDGQRLTSLTISDNLCTKGTVSNFTYSNSMHKWTWNCENTIGKTKDCFAIQPYCGDGILDSGEICDPKDPNQKNWGNNGCSDSCQAVNVSDPVCNSSYNGKRVDSLVEGDYLCDEGAVTGFKYNTGTYTWTWSCENSLKKSVSCSAVKPYCGDGIKDGGELCDPKDSSKEGWGSDGCDDYCKPIDISFSGCDETFYDDLRYKWEYTFSDKFNSRGSDSWLRSFDVNFVEQKDFNKGANPTFSWTQELKDNNMKVGKNQTMKVIESSPKYKVLDVPDKRARNNLYIEYEIKYSTTQNGTANKGHKECIYYEISRCGDGVLDTDYDEICDPADPNQVGWGNGGCSDTCEPVTKVDEPECNSDYNGKTVTELVGGDYLCNKGTITGFNYNDATHKWTWRCENSLGSGVNCSANKPYDGTLLIDKTLVGSKEIKNTGDLITWNIKVTATGGNVTDFVVVDHLPDVLEYKSYSIVNNPGLTVSEPVVSGKNIEWDVKGTLKNGESLEISVVTSVTEMPKIDYENVACVIENPGDKEKCDKEDLPVMKVRIVKTFTDGTKVKTVGIGDTIAYKVSFGNSGTASASITSLKDFLPKNVSYVSSEIFINGKSVHSEVVSGSEIINTGTRVDGVYVDIYGGITLNPGDSGYIILTGKVLSDNQDSRTNFACIYVNDEKIDCDDARHDITTTLACTAPVIDTKSFTKAGGTTNVVCKTTPAGEKADSIELDCGNGTIYTGSNISELSGLCTYPANSSSSSTGYSVVCKVNGDTADDCKGTVSVSGGGGGGGNDPYCKGPILTGTDRVKEVTCKTDNGRSAEIKIDCGYKDQVYTSTGKVPELTGKCDYTGAPNGTYTIKCYADNKNFDNCTGTVTYKGGGGGGGGGGGRKETVYVTGMSCFNVNAGNVSVEKGEVLPFYWNIEKLSESVKEGLYVEYETGTYKYGNNNYSGMYGQSCNEKGTMALNSMLCSFKITNGTGKVVASGTYPCLSDEAKNTANKPLIKRWIDWMENEYGVNSKGEKVVRSLDSYGKPMGNLGYVFRSNINYIENFASNETTLGEYKITLTQVDYLYCDENKKWEKGDPYKSVCESNFMVSDSYTVQKTPSGNLTASTEKLNNYLYIDGTSAFKASELLSAISVTEYQPNDKVNEAMDKFINKYEKLAVAVATGGEKKVPGKNIYFISGNYTIHAGQYNKPFTFVQTNPGATITVEGNVKYNMMLLTRGDIVFQGNCTTDQEVKGIFYSARNLRRGTMAKNDKVDKDNGVWCTNGGLHVKGVLIGNNWNNLMSQSRSNLNNWFGSISSTHRKSVIMNGASVLIEYSPSVFTKSTMPPGAEDFTTALSVYKN